MPLHSARQPVSVLPRADGFSRVIVAMRVLTGLLMLAAHTPAIADAMPPGPSGAYPPQLAAVLGKLSPAEADNLQKAANDFCQRISHGLQGALYDDAATCRLGQTVAISSVDNNLQELDEAKPSQYRLRLVNKCWALYRALGSGDVENLDHCLGDTLRVEAIMNGPYKPAAPRRELEGSSYCDKVFEASGRSYAILEGCLKLENEARQRVVR